MTDETIIDRETVELLIKGSSPLYDCAAEGQQAEVRAAALRAASILERDTNDEACPGCGTVGEPQSRVKEAAIYQCPGECPVETYWVSFADSSHYTDYGDPIDGDPDG